MKFMGLLFSKYASPYCFIDSCLENGRFFDFVENVMNEDNERQLWEFYLHKVNDKSFIEFKESLVGRKEETPIEPIETTVINSKSILNGFSPEVKGGQNGTI